MNPARTVIEPGHKFGCWTVLSEVEPGSTRDFAGKPVTTRRFSVECRCGRVELRYVTSLRRKVVPEYCAACLPRDGPRRRSVTHT